MRKKPTYERLVLVVIILLIATIYFLHSFDLRINIRAVRMSEIVKDDLDEKESKIITSQIPIEETPTRDPIDRKKPSKTPPKGQEQLIQKMHKDMEENLKTIPPIRANAHRKVKATVIPQLNSEFEQADWQKVTGTEYHFNVYSAYHIIGRLPPEVLLIGTARTFTNDSIVCRIYYNDDGHNKTDNDSKPVPLKFIHIPGTIETMDENWNMTYAGVFVHCPYSKSMKPEVVSILLNNQTDQTTPSNMVQIQNKDELRLVGADQYKFKFSLCVLPIFHYDETFRLIEWIEFYKMMGVEQITLYNVSMGPAASCILHDLMEGGDPMIKLNVFPWHKNPIKNHTSIRSGRCAECALSAGSNDCLYRHRGISKYMALLDLDEFIMPREDIAKNYSQLIDYLDATKPEQSIGHYLFRNGFFARDHANEPKLLERCSGFQKEPLRYKVCRGLRIMANALREKELNLYNSRTKYIIKPEGVNQTGTHYANVMEPGYTTLNVPAEIAYSRHYRRAKLDPSSELHRVSQDFGNELVDNVASQVEYFRNKCKLPGWQPKDFV